MSSIANQIMRDNGENVTLSTRTFSVTTSSDYTYTVTDNCSILFFGASGSYTEAGAVSINGGTPVFSYPSGEVFNNDDAILKSLSHNLRCVGSNYPIIDLKKGETITFQKGMWAYTATIKILN